MLGKSGKKKKKKALSNDPTKLDDYFLESDEEEDDIPSWNPWYLQLGRTFDVGYIGLSDDDRSSVSEGAPEKDPQWFTKEEVQKMGEFWQIQKLVKFVKVADQTTTALCLACLADFDYTIYSNQVAVIETGGLEILINILQSSDLRCQLGSLRILSMLSVSASIQRTMLNLGAIPHLLKLLCFPVVEVQTFSSITLANLTLQRRTRTIVRKKNGIPVMMQLLDRPNLLKIPERQRDPDNKEEIALIKSVIKALNRITRSPAIRRQLFQCGLIKLVPPLLATQDHEIFIAAMNIIQLCCSMEGFRLAIVTGNLLRLMVKPLDTNDPLKQELACRIIFKVGVSEVGRRQIGKFKLLEYLVKINRKDNILHHEKLLKYNVGALWRASKDSKNLEELASGQLVTHLLGFLDHKNINVRCYVAGCLAEFCQQALTPLTILKAGGIPVMISLLNREWHTELLENLSCSLGMMAECKDCVAELAKYDAMRVVWSHVNGKTTQLQVNASLALVPMIKNFPESSELVRSYVGGQEMLLDNLKSSCINVVASACEALAQVMKDEENLMILSDLRIVEKLTNLTKTDNDLLRESLARAIASCVMSSFNSTLFGKLGAITPMVHYLASPNTDVVVAAAYALWKLSMEPINCITLHRSGVVPFLVHCVGSEDERLQEAAGGCLQNIRNLAYEADQRAHLMGNIIAPIKKHKMFKSNTYKYLFASSISNSSVQPK